MAEVAFPFLAGERNRKAGAKKPPMTSSEDLIRCFDSWLISGGGCLIKIRHLFGCW
jgi:hypothetical protein